ncbi:uncharacterized protein LOC116206995 isoform X1 [Punica granatum]|uniref:Uncharacterized protein LOC116206995 isoform X1 n=1 Tax=Punica granatum TaxID=22663 RepID=A0A6P8DEM9_PUNGR|nr:uncharacterized protein LOC116206995 isoform X1 [Punica granatum]XP_031395703.1 uncharacterized protein LOC116206995 isoform X1 [Punica granatum]XP_031395704.1 uncharacterized protein LOC116206995 isoform X1 [Punica granatum]
MEEDESLKRMTECLRGRLVAERQQSKAAREDADQLGNKLKELEDKLKEETKMRDRAEKKLRLLQGKLESMKTAARSSDDSEQQSSSSLSENSLVSCESSTTTTVTSGTPKQPQEQEAGPWTRNGVMLVNLGRNASETTEPKQTDGSSCTGDDQNSCITETSMCREKVCLDLDGFKPADHSNMSSSSSRKVEEEEDDGVDNSLALVPVDNVFPEESQAREMKVISRSVSEVLEALRLAREGIQRSMKRAIKLGLTPAQAC